MENREELLYTYACEKFEQQKYDEALEALILLYGKGYERDWIKNSIYQCYVCLLYTSPSPRDLSTSRMPSSA